MTVSGFSLRRGALILAGAAFLALPATVALSSGIAALGTLEKGRWQVREMDGAVPQAAICLGDPAQLLQFAHRGGGGACRSEILESAGNSATVQYRCPRRGFGHSHIRVETPRSVRVETQGLRNGRPFSYRLEAQRVGAC
jgi:hypothetical protein